MQFGRPEQIYTEPATPFVARFTGLSGELAVRIAAQDADADGTVEIGMDGSALLRPCRARTSASWAAGGDGVLLVRPTGLHLGRANDGDHHLVGTVADVAFRGRGYEHAIDLPSRRCAAGGSRRSRVRYQGPAVRRRPRVRSAGAAALGPPRPAFVPQSAGRSAAYHRRTRP